MGRLLLPAQTLTLVELNCENLFDCRHDSLKQDTEWLPDGQRNWSPARYWRKLNRIGQEILSCLDSTTQSSVVPHWQGSSGVPDLVALVEVENDSVVFDLTHRSLLRGAGYEFLMTESPDVRGIDVALLYQPFTFRPICYDYLPVADKFRPSHADYTYHCKYGVRDHRGGGRSSARITISRCVAGALAKLALQQTGITIRAYTSQVGHIALEHDYRQYDLSQTESNIVRCPDQQKAEEMIHLIEQVKADGDTIGGTITCVVQGCPPGMGSPEFGKLHAQLGAAMLSINAVKGFEYGEGFNGLTMRGSEQNDAFAAPVVWTLMEYSPSVM